MVCNYNATIFANTKTVESSAGVISAPNELIVKLDEASIDLGNGLISEEEYNKKNSSSPSNMSEDEFRNLFSHLNK